MSWVIGGITLPSNPTFFSWEQPPKIEEQSVDGDDSDAACNGRGLATLILQGNIYEVGSSNASLMSKYLTPFIAMIATEIAISTPDSQFNGDWIFAFKFSRVAEGEFYRYSYTITLTKGKHNVINEG